MDKGDPLLLKSDMVSLKRSEHANVVNGQTEQFVNFQS